MADSATPIEKVKRSLKAVGTSIGTGIATGALVGGACGMTSGYYIGQPLLAHGIAAAMTGGGAGAIYLPITDFMTFQRDGRDPLNHVIAGAFSGYFLAAAYGGLQSVRVGIVGGALTGLAIGLGEEAFANWRIRMVASLQSKIDDERRLAPLIELERAFRGGALTRNEYNSQRADVVAHMKKTGIVDTRKPVLFQGYTKGGDSIMLLGGGGEMSKNEGIRGEPKKTFFDWPQWWFWHALTDEEVAQKKAESERMKLVHQRMEMLKLEKKMMRKQGEESA